MATANRRPTHDLPAVPSSSPAGETEHPNLAIRAAITIGTAILAAAAWLVARLLLPERFAGVASFCAAWIALYPAARFYARGPAWAHWGGGALVILVWLLTLWLR